MSTSSRTAWTTSCWGNTWLDWGSPGGLNDVLLRKYMTGLWQSWRSKFGCELWLMDSARKGKLQICSQMSSEMFVYLTHHVLLHKELESKFITRYSNRIGNYFDASAVTVDMMSRVCIWITYKRQSIRHWWVNIWAHLFILLCSYICHCSLGCFLCTVLYLMVLAVVWWYG